MGKGTLTKNLIYVLFLTLLISGFFAFFTKSVFASSTDGAIDNNYKYAWGENIGWINFGATEGNIHVTDSVLTGYIWAENIGWISLNCSNDLSCATVDYKVANDGEGTLTGYAWSENTSWINFNPTYGGVTVNSSGEFLGYAWGENIGWIVFSCSTTNSCATVDYKVKTDWRPRSARPACNNSLDDNNNGLIDYPADPGCSSLDDTDENTPQEGGIISYYTPPVSSEPTVKPEPTIEPPPPEITPEEIISETTPIVEKPPREPIIEKIPEFLKPLIPGIFKPKPPETKPTEAPIEELVAKEAPLAFQDKWQLLPTDPIREFVLAPLPKSIRNLAQKFPELEKTLKEVGVSKITDIAKLKFVKLTLPGLTERAGLPIAKVEPGKFALPQGVPVAKLSPAIKQQLPTEIVFAKTGGELIDFNIALSVTDKGEPQQKIATISGKPLQLVIKLDKPVKSVKGYVVWKQKNPKSQTLNPKQIPISQIQNPKPEISLNSLLASVFFAVPSFAKTQEKPVRVEEKLVLLEFEYTDPDGDGIYTAEIQAPLIEGEYEIITVMDFEDLELGPEEEPSVPYGVNKKEIRMIVVVDPEGYVYEKDGDKETRIPGAIISLFWLNSETKQYELWPAKEYQQENPQTTDVRGTYSFLVPEGYYYLKAEAPGYLVYDGKPFQVKEGSGIHINIELKTKYWWLNIVDWKTILLVVVIILLLYNFYRDKIREKFLKR